MIAGITGTRVRYLLLPVIALLVVVGVQVVGSQQQPAAPLSDTSVSLPAAGSDLGEPVIGSDIAPVGILDTSDTDRRIAFWRERTQQGTQSEIEWIYLGDLLDQKGRMTGDVSQFVAAGEAYQTALDIAPNSAAGHAGQARVLTTLHDFSGALAAATRVLQLEPASDGALSIVFDASLELGNLDNARTALELLDERSNAPSVMTRHARLSFIEGDSAAAATLAVQAADDALASANLPATVAFFQYTAAEYLLLNGDTDGAAARYGATLDALPGYPLAGYGLARVAYARGDLAGAIAHLEPAVAAVPRPDMLAFLGDLYAVSGNQAQAADQYATVDFIAQTTASSGPVFDREYAFFLADHGRDLEHALALAQSEITEREDVHGWDALAWALHANGRSAEALDASRRALALGTADPRMLMHAGLIELANGLEDEGRAHLETALALGPQVSPLVVEMAREALGR